eukprot:CAMPEP_0202028086 /NCGR_PEP_ID=MMETSP0905-20130828/63054_1 /ASSEMBLY_ACC=CAM_ASM_000554 /TAXON_ID=420261 /ORGANISM="Thalassiosira antarctica, Strain CCMP982" /LENGTH=320 /DNA_ID=CAMNT_0048591763 /DNA_START=47 /DNA_END=1006 /DNA_ORIENTATION=-
MALLKKRLSKDIAADSPSQAKKAKISNFSYAQLMMHASHRQQQQLQQLGITRSSTIHHESARAASRPASPPRQLPNLQCNIVTPCMPSPQEVLSQGQGGGPTPVSSAKNTIPNPSSLPLPPFEKTRVQPVTMQNPLEMLSSVSSHIAKKTLTTTVMKTVAPLKKRKPQANINDDSYVGERNVSGQRHGRGVMKYDNGCRYVGCFVRGKRHGFGKVWYPNGLGVYTGYWLHNKRHGSGTMSFANGDVYEGQWSVDQPNGVGTLTMTNGETYTGDFINQHKHGRGVYKWPNGDVYEGQWAKDVRHGAGIISSNEGVCKRVYY